ncbi:MAG: 50S ribosomal protein L4 [Candidatus Omnitrophica bacterium]|nr:50S ribosomal protein L4 [Candidatus Omnitrophota bacterium]
MTKLTVVNTKGKEVSKISLAEDVSKVNTAVLYQVVNKYMASQHRGTHKTKKRDEISGGGKKPWRQKGTGRARAGSIRSPLWRGGGVVFGPNVRSYSYTVPQKARQLALREAIKSKIKDNSLVVFDSIILSKPKTKDMASVLRALKVEGKCLMVTEAVDNNTKLASRNIPNFSIKNRKDINALDILLFNKLAISEESLKKVMGKIISKQ